MFYTYAHYTPSGELFYIGKGQGQRMHSRGGRNAPWREVVANNGGFSPLLLAEWPSEQEAFEHEIALIACFKELGFKLCNKAAGGQGGSGWKHTEEWRRIASAKRQGAGNHFHGKRHTERTKAAISAAKQGVVGPWLGKKRSEETKLKISLALTGKPGRKHTPEAKAKMSAARLKRTMPPVSEETRRKLSVAATESWSRRKQHQLKEGC